MDEGFEGSHPGIDMLAEIDVAGRQNEKLRFCVLEVVLGYAKTETKGKLEPY